VKAIKFDCLGMEGRCAPCRLYNKVRDLGARLPPYSGDCYG